MKLTPLEREVLDKAASAPEGSHVFKREKDGDLRELYTAAHHLQELGLVMLSPELPKGMATYPSAFLVHIRHMGKQYLRSRNHE